MSLLLHTGPTAATAPIMSMAARVAALTDAEVSALAAAHDLLDIVARFDALVAVAGTDLIDLEWPITVAFHARPTGGQTTPTEDRLAFAAIRDAALAYATAGLHPRHHVTLTASWVGSIV